MGEFNLYGVYIPTLLVQAILAYALFKIVVIGTDKLIERGWIGYPGLFNLSLYIVVLMFVHWLFELF